jgi:hypothetical protein
MRDPFAILEDCSGCTLEHGLKGCEHIPGLSLQISLDPVSLCPHWVKRQLESEHFKMVISSVHQRSGQGNKEVKQNSYEIRPYWGLEFAN